MHSLYEIQSRMHIMLIRSPVKSLNYIGGFLWSVNLFLWGYIATSYVVNTSHWRSLSRRVVFIKFKVCLWYTLHRGGHQVWMYFLRMEEWALYNSVWIVNSHLCLNSEISGITDRQVEWRFAGQVSQSCVDDQQGKFLCSLHVEY